MRNRLIYGKLCKCENKKRWKVRLCYMQMWLKFCIFRHKFWTLAVVLFFFLNNLLLCVFIKIVLIALYAHYLICVKCCLWNNLNGPLSIQKKKLTIHHAVCLFDFRRAPHELFLKKGVPLQFSSGWEIFQNLQLAWKI